MSTLALVAARLSAQMQDKAMRIMTAPDAVSHDVDLGASHVVTSMEMGAADVLGEDVPMPGDGTPTAHRRPDRSSFRTTAK